MRFSHYGLLIYIALFLFNSNAAFAFDSGKYVEAKRLTNSTPKYPKERINDNQGGLVEVLFVVNKEGKTEMPIVVKSTDPEFERSALRYISQQIYEPATLDGLKVSSQQQMIIRYAMRGLEDGVSRTFYRQYRKAQKALKDEKPDRVKLDKMISKLGKGYYLNMYSLAHKSFLDYLYASKFSSKQDQFNALERLLLFEGYTGKKGKFLSPNERESILVSLFALQIELGRFGEAIAAYEELNDEFPSRAKIYEKQKAELEKLIAGDRPYKTEFTLNGRGDHHIQLTGDQFTYQDLSGNISTLSFRCEAGAASIQFRPASDFKTPKNWGKCYLQTSGDPGTKASLIQVNISE